MVVSRCSKLTHSSSNNRTNQARKKQQTLQNIYTTEEQTEKHKKAMNSYWEDQPGVKEKDVIRVSQTNINGLSYLAEIGQHTISSTQFKSNINGHQELNVNV